MFLKNILSMDNIPAREMLFLRVTFQDLLVPILAIFRKLFFQHFWRYLFLIKKFFKNKVPLIWPICIPIDSPLKVKQKINNI